MTTNRRAQNKHTPYKLETGLAEVGCYKDAATASQIGRGMVRCGDANMYIVRDLNDNIVDSSD